MQIFFPIIKQWELLKYKHRKRKLYNTLNPIVWTSHINNIKEDLDTIHEEYPDAVNEELYDKLTICAAEVKSTINRQGFLTFSLIAFLLFSLFKIELPFLILGFRLVSTPWLNEILVVLISVLSFYTIGRTVKYMTIVRALKAILLRIKPKETQYFHKLLLGIEDIPVYYDPKMNPYLVQTITLGVARQFVILFQLIKVVGIIFFSLIWRYFVYLEIWFNPDIDVIYAKFVVILSICFDLISVVILIIYLVPLPRRDYSVNLKLEIAEQLGADELSKVQEEYFSEALADENYMIEKGYLSRADT